MTPIEAQRVHAILKTLDGCSVREIQDALRLAEQMVTSTTVVKLDQADWPATMEWLCNAQPVEG